MSMTRMLLISLIMIIASSIVLWGTNCTTDSKVLYFIITIQTIVWLFPSWITSSLLGMVFAKDYAEFIEHKMNQGKKD